ncbi:hypothetical protein GCM10022239_05770 [Leifsonia bigeumensis]|uniref:GFO/IDH/MocA-like oxidoreductase domain-containing protein n=1 Tax=Leifsonella bigeumensis TaxID=433643 RepID=A0ABP7F5W3_9MICO
MGNTRESRSRPLTIGFIGLATSHPFADAATIISRHPDAAVQVWEPEADRLAVFLDRFPTASAHDGLAGVIDSGPDGAIISTRPPEIAAAVSALADHEIPVFINKPAAATLEQLADVDAQVRPIAERVLSTSVLRFAEPVQSLAARIDLDRVLTARATVRHDVARWLAGSTDWQDDVRVGGGAIVTIGIHGMELLVTLLGARFEIESTMSGIRHLEGLKSEDTAVIGVRWSNGVLGTIEVIGATEEERYSVALETLDGTETIELRSGGQDPFGYERTIEHFLGMVDAGRRGLPIVSPVAWEHTHAILEGIVTASSRAHHRAGILPAR